MRTSSAICEQPCKIAQDGTFLLRNLQETSVEKSSQVGPNSKGFSLQQKKFSKVLNQLVLGQSKIWFQIFNFDTRKYEIKQTTYVLEGSHCRIFIDDSCWQFFGSSAFESFEEIALTFDEKIYPSITSWMGKPEIPSHLNLPDDKIYILLSDIKGEQNSGYIAGFFNSRDLIDDQGNQKPLIFMDMNPGRPGNPTDPNNEFYRTLAHEFQHLINFSRHLSKSGKSEERWVEEGLSLLSEYIYSASITSDGIGIPTSPHLARFLEKPEICLTTNSFNEWYQPATMCRHYGASFLFMYYLLEKFGGSDETSQKNLFKEIVGNEKIGVEGIDSSLKKLGSSFTAALKNWILANYLNDVSLSNGLWGYLDKDRRLGSEAIALPLPGQTFAFTPYRSLVGGEGRIFSNSGGKYENILGSGFFKLVFKAYNEGFTPFVAAVDHEGSAALIDLKFNETLLASLSLDLSQYRRLILVPAVLSNRENIADPFVYSFTMQPSKTVIYPTSSPVTSNEFTVFLKSPDGIVATPTVNIEFNNQETTSKMLPVDENRSIFMVNYKIPGPGRGVVRVKKDDENSSFSFYRASLKENSMNHLTVKDIDFMISSREAGDQAMVLESPALEIPQELTILSKAYYTVFNPGKVIEARLQFTSGILGISNHSSIGLWSPRNSQNSWVKVSHNEKGFFCPIASEGAYVLVTDLSPPRIHDFRIEQEETKPLLVARIEENGSGIQQESIRVQVDGNSVPFSFDETNKTITADLMRLPKGLHRFAIEVSDKAENVGRVNFQCSLPGPLSVIQAAACPNPSSGETNVFIFLEGNGAKNPDLEIEAKIFDLTGKKLISLPMAYKSNGTFATHWDGKDETAKNVPNGEYPFKVIIKRGGDEIKSSGKIVVSR
ncbi:MAG: hypothetical protein HQM08_00775 [Candidatus Riflebacteria bacterium]|nr:hypothetical protein [Candidatus Riflebacteria bacterium]